MGDIPDVALEHIFGFLRLPDLVSCSLVAKHWRRNALVSLRRLKRVFASANRFTWEKLICVDGSTWAMEARIDPSMCYVPSINSIYLFGGSTPDAPVCRARFNDLWKLDMSTLCWERVVVRSSPFPVPKSLASFVYWKDGLLVLYGGYRPMVQAPIRVANEALSEVHLFNVKSQTWRQLETISEGPGLCGHSAAVSNNLMIVFGGVFAENNPNHDLWCLELMTGRWFKPEMARGAAPTSRLFATFVPIGETSLLLVGGTSAGQDETSSDAAAWVLSWNADDIEQPWTWKRKVTAGRRCGEAGDRNRSFTAVAWWKANGRLRLASLGISPHPRGSRTMRQMRAYDRIEEEMRTIVCSAKSTLDKKFRERFSHLAALDAESLAMEFETMKTNIEFDVRGITIRVLNMWNIDSELRKFSRVSGSVADVDPVRVRADTAGKRAVVETIRDPSKCLLLRDCDVAEMAVQIRHHVASLHTRYYLCPPEPRRPPRAVVRKALMPRLVLFTADATDIETEDMLLRYVMIVCLNKVVYLVYFGWTAQPEEMRASPLCKRFSLIATRGELIMHGGMVESDQSVGATYLLTPVGNN